jgi:hypothetical protein
VTRFSPQSIRAAADVLGVDPAVVSAVAEIEAAGGGFLPDGRPKILFEAHLFSRLTGGQYDQSNPSISSAKWNRKLYKGGALEWGRLEAARRINRSFADQSASWGAFQILGSNYKAAGFQTVSAFVTAMESGHDAHLAAFVNFVKANPAMHQALQSQDWAEFARRYNGPSYAANQYDKKLAAAFARQLSAAQLDPPAKSDGKAAQAALNASGYRLSVDGYAGPRTQEAIEAHQRASGVPVSGGLDNATRESLGLPVDKILSGAQAAAGAVGGVVAAVAPIAGMDWRIVAVVAGTAILIGGGYLIHRHLKVKEARA